MATNLTSAFAETEQVLLIDGDPQGSARDWAETQTRMNLEVMGVNGGRLVD